MSPADREAYEEEQLRLAIENSLADIRTEKNEFESQDLAFFTDAVFTTNPGNTPENRHLNNTSDENVVSSKSDDAFVRPAPTKDSHIAGKGTIAQPPYDDSREGNQSNGGKGTFAQPTHVVDSYAIGKGTFTQPPQHDRGELSQLKSGKGTFAQPTEANYKGNLGSKVAQRPIDLEPVRSQSNSSGGGLFGRISSILSDISRETGVGAADRKSSTSHTPAATNDDSVVCRACLQPCTTSVFSSISTIRAANNDLYHANCFICGTCRNPIRGQYLQHTSSPYPYHPDCFRCGGCDLPISGNFKDYGEPPLPYHAECYKELYHPRCCLCTHSLEGQFYKHPFFENEMYCMSHESLPSCFACARKQPLPASRREGFADLMDGRSLCAQCSGSIIVDSSEAVALYQGIVEFMGRDLGLTIPPEMYEVPVLVVDVQSLNENMNRKDGSLGYHDAGESSAAGKSTVRGLTLSTCCEVRHFPSGSMAFNQIAGAFRSGHAPALFTTSEVRDVTAVLVLYGLPKDLIASILAHEAMHVWLKLNKQFPFRMPPKLEEGLCQVIAYLYLESIRAFDAGETLDRQDASLRSYFCQQIRDDLSPVYGDGFRDAYKAVQLLGLDIVLEYVQENHQLPDISM